jgi:hypothetical protein
VQFVGCVPACAIHKDDGVGLCGDVAADLVEMQLHGFGVGPWQHESGPCASPWAYGSKQIGVLIALVCRLLRARSLFCPHSGLSILLANTRFVLEPDLDGFVLSNTG